MSATSFFAPAGSVFDFSRQTGTRAAVTATVDRSVASRSAVLLGGMAAGALWAGIPGVLKATVGAHEVVTTIMLNYIAQWLLRFLIIGGPLQLGPGTSKSLPIGEGAHLATVLPVDNALIIFGLPASVYRVHTGLLIALAAAALFAFLLWRTSFGYEIRAVGQSQKAARYAGVSVRRTIIVTMLPITKPHAPGLNMVIIGLSFVLVGPMKPRQGLATILDQGPMGPSQSFTIR